MSSVARLVQKSRSAKKAANIASCTEENLRQRQEHGAPLIPIFAEKTRKSRGNGMPRIIQNLSDFALSVGKSWKTPGRRDARIAQKNGIVSNAGNGGGVSGKRSGQSGLR